MSILAVEVGVAVVAVDVGVGGGVLVVGNFATEGDAAGAGGGADDVVGVDVGAVGDP